MARGRRDDDDKVEYAEVEAEELDDEVDEEGRGRKGGRKRRRSVFIDDMALEGEEDEDEDDGGRRSRKQRRAASDFLDIEAEVDTDEEEEEEEEEDEGEDDFINDAGANLPDEDDNRRPCRPSILMQEDQEDIEEIERLVYERYSKLNHTDYSEDATNVEEQALLPSVEDAKLWLVKCAIGHERETAICLMQKFMDRPDLQIKSVIALDHLENYIYVEAEKEAHVLEACKGLRNIYSSTKAKIVPIKEMTGILSVKGKHVDLSRDTWVRMKFGTYKGDLAKIINVDDVRQKVTVKLIPRVDLQALANKLEVRDIRKGKAFVPPPRLFNIDEAREMHIRVTRRRNKDSGEYFEMVDGLMFKDGFLYKTVSAKSISTQNLQPTLDELEKFRKPGDDATGDVASLTTLFANRKKGHFMKGDAVMVVRGDLKNLKGWVEKVEEETIHVRPKMSGVPKTLAFNEKDLLKYFKQGNHVKVVAGMKEGATGMVVKVERHFLIILSDTTKEHIRVFAGHAVKSSEITTGLTRVGGYELRDLVLLHSNMSFGVIIRVEAEAFQVLKGSPDWTEVSSVRLSEMKCKIERRSSAKDRSNNTVSVKDMVRVIDGPSRGKQGLVECIREGILFIYDRHHLEHAGFICAKAQSCIVVGGSNGSSDRNVDSRFGAQILQSPRLPPRTKSLLDFERRSEQGSLKDKCVKIRSGEFKGYRGRVKEVKGSLVRIELEARMEVVIVDRDDIVDTADTATPFPDSRYGLCSETPMHPHQTPLRDAAAGMRTPVHDRAWFPSTPARRG